MGLLPFELHDDRSAAPPGGSGSSSDPLTVGQVSTLIVQALADQLPATLRVRGELTNFTSRNGHWFFSLRDDDASIDGVMWATQARLNAHQPTAGEAVLVTGRVGHWGKGGRTRLEARRVEAAGAGDQRAAFLKLCGELRELGWFDEAHKQTLPPWPRRVAVVTSLKGAALTDVIATAALRFPATALLVVDVRVQGDAAAGEVATAISLLDAARDRLGLDAIIVTRGGGSSEDLVAFNDRGVAEAVHLAKTPIIAAIGHESDTTIIELVADVRASTPTQAVTRLLPDHADVLDRFESLGHRLKQSAHRVIQLGYAMTTPSTARLSQAIARRLQRDRLRIDAMAARIQAARPDRKLQRQRNILQPLSQRLNAALRRLLDQQRARAARCDRLREAVERRVQSGAQQVQGLARAMSAVDPLAVLDRGYSITTDAHGRAVRSLADVEIGQAVVTRLATGQFGSRVESISDEPPTEETETSGTVD